MFQRMLASALFAGGVVGLLAALLHFAFVQDLILLGEKYETGELTHFAAPAEDGHDHAPAPTPGTDAGAAPDDGHDDDGHADDGHSHGTGSDLTRNGLTVLFTVLVYVSYAMLLAAGFGLAESMGRRIDLKAGVLWGISGFAAFQLAPAMGLAPELPGSIAADLGDRQVWWWGTALATATALGLLGYGRSLLTAGLAVVLLAAPHVIGAPLPEGYWGQAPTEVGTLYSARTLGTGLAVWAALGGALAWFWTRGKAA